MPNRLYYVIDFAVLTLALNVRVTDPSRAKRPALRFKVSSVREPRGKCVVLAAARLFRRAFSALLLVPLLLLTALPASAEVLILYQAEDRPDTDPSKDLWRYTYELTGHAFAELEGFTLYFEADSASELRLDPKPAEWAAETFDPDRALRLPGGLVAQATQDLTAGLWQFSVEFVRLGDATPGSQRYELFDADFVQLDPPGTLGTVQVIPEPQAGPLILTGLALLAALSMRRRVARATASWWR
jgi:hypothetical protein